MAVIGLKCWWKSLWIILIPTRFHLLLVLTDLEDTTYFYRQNCDWSILQAMEIVGKSMVISAWKFIILTNEHSREEAERLAKKLGITRFRVVKVVFGTV